MSDLPIEKLSEYEKEELRLCEGKIQGSIFHFNEMCKALHTIQENRLYRESYSSYESYVRSKWSGVLGQLSKQHIYRLASSGEIIENLEKSNQLVTPPAHESQLRPLNAVPPEYQSDVWNEAVEATQGRPTAKAVQEAAERLLPSQSFNLDSFMGDQTVTPPKPRHEAVEADAPELEMNAAPMQVLPPSPAMPPKVPPRNTNIGKKWQPSTIVSRRFDDSGRRLLNVYNPFSGRTDKDIEDCYFDEDSGRQTTTNFYEVQKVKGTPLMRDIYGYVTQALEAGEFLKGLEAIKYRLEIENETGEENNEHSV